MSEPVLQMQDVAHPGLPGRLEAFEALNLELCEGEAVLVSCSEGQAFALPDLIAGLLQPERGKVLYCGKAWKEMRIREQDSHRGSLRIQVSNGGWVNNLTMMENIILQCREHSGQRDAQLLSEASELGRKFDLDPIPGGHPHELGNMIRSRCAWVRLCMGQPSLIYVEDSSGGLRAADVPKLLNELKIRVAGGAALLVVASRPEIWDSGALQYTRRLAYADERFGEMIAT